MVVVSDCSVFFHLEYKITLKHSMKECKFRFGMVYLFFETMTPKEQSAR